MPLNGSNQKKLAPMHRHRNLLLYMDRGGRGTVGEMYRTFVSLSKALGTTDIPTLRAEMKDLGYIQTKGRWNQLLETALQRGDLRGDPYRPAPREAIALFVGVCLGRWNQTSQESSWEEAQLKLKFKLKFKLNIKRVF